VQQDDEIPPPGSRGFVRCAVMDGKAIGHRVSNSAYICFALLIRLIIQLKICAVPQCKNPLVNYRDGRFCRQHKDEYTGRCGIANCGREAQQGGMTCDLPDHQRYWKAWSRRFRRIPYQGLQRVIRQQYSTDPLPHNPQWHTANTELHVQRDLPSLDGIDGAQVRTTFRARKVFCIETIQWSCGFPIAWGKCYDSESPSQVLKFINDIWHPRADSRPAFIIYDNACKLLPHIIAQGWHDFWLGTTRFIVDVFHYISHSDDDTLCREWCNPAPMDGSQPDLVVAVSRSETANSEMDGLTNATERPVLTRAFNTETAEQFNSWLDKFEAQMKQMTDVHFDFFLHSLMLIYKERLERKIAKRGQALTVFAI
jgi:hypothetical protein